MTAVPEISPSEVQQRRPMRAIVAYFRCFGTLDFGGSVALVGLK
jgi:hypothetical protein